MKLVEIEDVRVGQIWQSMQVSSILYVATNCGDDCVECYKYDCGEFIHNTILQLNFAKLIGFIGITHEIKDSKLVEIPRANIEIDDVVKDNFNHFSHVINREIFEHSINKLWPDEKCFEAINGTYGSRDFASFEIKKIGIYGVTHEFVDERLVR